MNRLTRKPVADAGIQSHAAPDAIPKFYDMYRSGDQRTPERGGKSTFQIDLGHLQRRMNAADRHLIERLVAFFATGDSIVANNVVLTLVQHINAPEARMYLRGSCTKKRCMCNFI